MMMCFVCLSSSSLSDWLIDWDFAYVLYPSPFMKLSSLHYCLTCISVLTTTTKSLAHSSSLLLLYLYSSSLRVTYHSKTSLSLSLSLSLSVCVWSDTTPKFTMSNPMFPANSAELKAFAQVRIRTKERNISRRSNNILFRLFSPYLRFSFLIPSFFAF